jgi:hypothetical protein
LTFFRNILLELTGDDVFDEAPFKGLIDFHTKLMRENDNFALFTGAHVSTQWVGGAAFMNAMAAKYHDGHAAWVQQRLLKPIGEYLRHPQHIKAFRNSIIWGFLTYNPEIDVVQPPRVKQHLLHFEDSGLVHYKNEDSDVTLCLKCGAWPTYSAHQRVTCVCDRLAISIFPGHFDLYVGTTPMVVKAAGAYRLDSFLGNTLLVDGKGQYGDIGYPMSLSGYRYRGDRVQKVRWDEKTGHGFIRLELHPAYPEELGMVQYIRDIIVFPEKKIICRDFVIFDKPHRLSWLFHALPETTLTLNDDVVCTFDNPKTKLQLQPVPIGFDVVGSINETESVNAYVSWTDYKPYHHVRYDTAQPTTSATIDFVFTWD